MSMIEQVSAVCLARRDRLARDRRATVLATIATLTVFTFVIIAAFGGLK